MRLTKKSSRRAIGISIALGVAVLAIAGWTYAGGEIPFGSIGGCWGDARYTQASTSGIIGENDVAAIAEGYVASYRSADLVIEEIMEFDNHYYVEVEESSTGRYAFEFLIDRSTGRATPEPGPNMMWNLKYGHMNGGMMSMSGIFSGFGNDGVTMTLSEDDAYDAAQSYLTGLGSGLEADHHAAAYYGYYTLHTLRDSQIVGMLSVNGFTGEVWPHTWHGAYLGQLGSEIH
jgi:hypothetical protein